jgi:hypothetical protein
VNLVGLKSPDFDKFGTRPVAAHNRDAAARNAEHFGQECYELLFASSAVQPQFPHTTACITVSLVNMSESRPAEHGRHRVVLTAVFEYESALRAFLIPGRRPG